MTTGGLIFALETSGVGLGACARAAFSVGVGLGACVTPHTEFSTCVPSPSPTLNAACEHPATLTLNAAHEHPAPPPR